MNLATQPWEDIMSDKRDAWEPGRTARTSTARFAIRVTGMALVAVSALMVGPEFVANIQERPLWRLAVTASVLAACLWPFVATGRWMVLAVGFAIGAPLADAVYWGEASWPWQAFVWLTGG